MSKLDDILEGDYVAIQAMSGPNKGKVISKKQQIKDLMLEIMRETENDGEIYWGDGMKTIEKRIIEL